MRYAYVADPEGNLLELIEVSRGCPADSRRGLRAQS